MTLSDLKRWLYREERPSRLARSINSIFARVYGLGIVPDRMVTLEITGRRSGRVISLPVVMVVDGGERYLVSMLGEEVAWVRNVRAAGGRARLRHGTTENVELVRVPVEDRAPILRAYLQVAPGARPHVPVHKDAPLEEFERIAPQFPVFRVKAA